MNFVCTEVLRPQGKKGCLGGVLVSITDSQWKSTSADDFLELLDAVDKYLSKSFAADARRIGSRLPMNKDHMMMLVPDSAEIVSQISVFEFQDYDSVEEFTMSHESEMEFAFMFCDRKSFWAPLCS